MGDTVANESGSLEDRDILSVSDLNAQINDTLGYANYLQNIVCRGEITERSDYNNTVFMSLDSADADDDTTIQLVMWANILVDSAVPGEVGTGDEVLVEGSVEVYEPDGQLQLRGERIERIGEGAEQARIEALRANLGKRGWFDKNRKQPVPSVPERVGMVTSADGDARHDIVSEVSATNPAIAIDLESTTVQGECAPTELATGIEAMDVRDDVDVIVVGRGGGSAHNLAAFSTEHVAEAIHQAETPVVAAVGHREDSSIAGDVADAVVSTPSSTSTLFRDRDDLLAEFDELESGLDNTHQGLVNERTAALENSVEIRYTDYVRERLDDYEDRIEYAYQEHERAAAVEEAESSVPTVYRAAIVALIIVVIGLVLLFIFT